MTDTAQPLSKIKNFEQLIHYLEEELDWPCEEYGFDEITFRYAPSDLGIKEEEAAQITSIHQLRPFFQGQPWGIFFIEFEKKRIPVVLLRRVLSHLVIKKRASANRAETAAWNIDNLLFISAFGDVDTDRREIAFAHFHQEEDNLPTLRVLGWDGADTVLKMEYVAKTLKEKLRWPENPRDVETWRAQWTGAFRHKPGYVIKTAKELAERLAELARNIRAAAETIMEHESEKGSLRKLHKAFQTALIHDLSEEDFADYYAQTITYGLLTAAISRTDLSGGQDGTTLVAENVTDMVPITNPFLREMLETFLHVGGRQGKASQDGIDFDELGIQDVVELLRSDETDLPAILRDFGNRAPGEDPVIRFYEDFLAAYDKKLKVQRGVFYTPKPIVSYIVRSVQELLKTEFGLEDGLAATVTWAEMHARSAEVKIPKGVSPNSSFVMILDPATGTATFLVEVIDVVERTMKTKWARDLQLSKPEEKDTWKHHEIVRRWNEYVPASLLPRLYGYELMMAPYAIAHMKIGLKLFETGYRFASDQRANIYLTNALEEPSQLADNSAASLFEALGHESQAVNDVKQEVHFTVVIGNPPYANRGMLNKGDWILSLLEEYKKGLDEQKLNLDDDFIKFIRIGQWQINKTGCGILAYITNNTYLDGVTHRRIRQSLLETFEHANILNLHGNSKRKEMSPDGSKDENVFDIQQGVGISIFTKAGQRTVGVFHSDLWGVREQKYLQLTNTTIGTTNWRELNDIDHKSCLGTFYFFEPKSLMNIDEYCTGWAANNIFLSYSNGIETHRDEISIHDDTNSLILVIEDLQNMTPEDFRKHYKLNADGRDWTVKGAKESVRKIQTKTFEPITILYRPFDFKKTFLNSENKGFIAYPRFDVMQHMINPNIGLVLARLIVRDDTFDAVLASRFVTEKKTGDSTRSSSLFPVYTYPSNVSVAIQTSLFSANRNPNNEGRAPNISSDFIADLESHLGQKFIFDGVGDLHKTFGPEDVFHYMYVIFHSPTYRSRYAEFLKIDFPRLPLTSNVALFRQLCGLGKELVGLHLLEASTLNKPITKFKGKGDNVVAKGHPKYQDGVVLVNSSQGFEGVPEDVWEFHIGGYQVCHKWLKDRRGWELSVEDITHYQKVVVSLKETIRLMSEVDAVIEAHGGWPMK